MNYSNTQPVSFLTTNASDVVHQVQEIRAPIAITVDGRIAAIVQDAATYQKTQDQLTMLRILAHSMRQVEEGKVADHDDFFARLAAEDSV